MAQIHLIVGSLVVLAYLILVIVNIVRLTGRPMPAVRVISIVAAVLLLIQYILGFALLGSGHSIPAIHYIVALLAIITVGAEHGYAGSRGTTRAAQLATFVATLATLILVVIAYSIGQANGS
ncbi:MAG TPA: hypothetical protein VFX03_08020 [Thermomicrobiales bacterium]|nr:hypothetical protein [Thermomicrobiales bacterium]